MPMTMQEATEKLLKEFRDLPGEFYMLKGVVCEQIALPRNERRYDTVMIAERMDEVRHVAA